MVKIGRFSGSTGMLQLREARYKRADITRMGRVSPWNFFGIARWLAEMLALCVHCDDNPVSL